MAINCRVSVQIRGGLTYGLGSVLANVAKQPSKSLLSDTFIRSYGADYVRLCRSQHEGR
jgi:hypothetical protein